ncbi:hypothetical protein [Vibrio parahaemolyticus]|uniref:hypothetical protein n=1 Tax=Vibrio parahaemolyticus TaxID=670 RepID=UPI0024AEEEE1|nr:hypothetical protein [Vibrio parahaemolyticus]MDI7855136.1 hypothetical protein [Vibrio parahaemolyticus]
MNWIFIVFNLIPLLLGWFGFSAGQPELVTIAIVVIAVRAALVLFTVPKMYIKFQNSDQLTRRYHRQQLKKPAVVFIVSFITLWSLVVWGEELVLCMVVLSTAMYHGMRNHIVRHSY